MLLKLAVLTATVWCAPLTAGACSCFIPDSVEEYLENADGAYVGTALGSRRIWFGKPAYMSDPVYETKLQVEQTFKGPDKAIIRVRHSAQSVSCGLNFPKGARAQIVLFKDEQGKLRTSKCSSFVIGAPTIFPVPPALTPESIEQD